MNELDTLGAHKGYRIVCVFDADRTANRRSGGGARRRLAPTAGARVVFSVTSDADSWIERASIEELAGVSSVDAVLRKTRQANGGRVASETERAANRDDAFGAGADGTGRGTLARRRTAGLDAVKTRAVCVATSDNALSSVVRGNGAYAVSAGSLVELTRARRDETEILRELSVKARWGGEKRGLAMVTKDASHGGQADGDVQGGAEHERGGEVREPHGRVLEQTQKGQEEQGEEVTPTPNMGTRPPATAARPRSSRRGSCKCVAIVAEKRLRSETRPDRDGSIRSPPITTQPTTS